MSKVLFDYVTCIQRTHPFINRKPKLVQIETSQPKVPTFSRGTVTGGHDDHDQFTEALRFAQDGMAEIFSLWTNEELTLGLNDLLLNRYRCGGPHLYNL